MTTNWRPGDQKLPNLLQLGNLLTRKVPTNFPGDFKTPDTV